MFDSTVPLPLPPLPTVPYDDDDDNDVVNVVNAAQASGYVEIVSPRDDDAIESSILF